VGPNGESIGLTSVLGQKPTGRHSILMSALPPEAAIDRRPLCVRLVPSAIMALVDDAGQMRAPSQCEVAAQQDRMAIADPGSSRHHQRS